MNETITFLLFGDDNKNHFYIFKIVRIKKSIDCA